MEIKDRITAQAMSAMTYKKTVIWTDLKIMPGSAKNADANDEIYTSEKIAEIHNQFDDYMQKLGYAPQKMSFKPLDVESNTAGDDDPDSRRNNKNSDLAKTLEATIESNIDMEELIKAKFLFSDEKIKDCLSSNTVQKTLRGQVE